MFLNKTLFVPEIQFKLIYTNNRYKTELLKHDPWNTIFKARNGKSILAYHEYVYKRSEENNLYIYPWYYNSEGLLKHL